MSQSASISSTAWSPDGAISTGLLSWIRRNQRWLSSTCRTLSVCPVHRARVPTARDIVPVINDLAARARDVGVPVIWMLHTNTLNNGYSDWEVFFNHVVRNPDIRQRMVESLSPETQKVWDDLVVDPRDTTIIKNRYSAFAHGASTLERVLRSRGIDTVLVGGTKTNVCCDSTARDAMMLDFKSIMVSDCCAASSDDEHLASLETFIQQFGDVMTSEEVMDRMIRRNDAAAAE